MVEHAKRTLYLKMLEAGPDGATAEALYEAMEEEGFSRDIAKAAIGKLVKKKHLAEKPGKVTVPLKKIPGTEIITVEVERVLPGAAMVSVNGQTAKLTPENYGGPRKLLKKNTAFKAQGNLYQLNGELHVAIRHIVQVL